MLTNNLGYPRIDSNKNPKNACTPNSPGKILTLIVLLIFSSVSYAQIITTVAGTGTAGYSGDGGAATAAKLDLPFAVTLDAFNNIYICDYENERIRKVTVATGVIITIAGTGTAGYNNDGIAATSAEVNMPEGIVVDGSGNVYISDYNNKRVRKITTATGIISTIAGTGTEGYSGDGGPATSAKISYPQGIALDAENNVYFADATNNRIRKITVSTGIITTVAGTGTGGYSGDGGQATSAKLNYPTGIAVDASGNLYIADQSNQRIRMVTIASGIITTIAGTGLGGYNGDNIPAATAKIYYPQDVALDALGNVYIADVSNSRVRKVMMATGIISTVAGTGTAGYNGDGIATTSAELYDVDGVAFDASGNMYIDDGENNRIREVINVPFIWNGTMSNNWTAPGNWTPTAPAGGPDNCAASVIIPVTTIQPVITSAIQVGNVTVNAGAAISIQSGASLSVCLSWTGGASSNATVWGPGVVILDGSAAQNISGNTQIAELQLNNASGAVMQTGSSLTIDTALDLVLGNFNATNGSITFISTSPQQVAIIDNFSTGYAGTISGAINAQRYYNASSTFNQHFMGSPVNSPALSQFGASGTAGYLIPKPNCDEVQMSANSPYGTVFSYHESNGATCGEAQWKVETSGNAQNGLGYSIVEIGSGTLMLSGTANLSSSYTISGLTNSNWSNVSAENRHMSSGWQLLSNPYLATLNLTTVNTGFDSQIQVWNDSGAYAGTYQPGTVGSSAIVAPFQAFMVHKTNPGGSLSYTINATDRTRSAAAFFSQNNNELNIIAENTSTGMLDKTTIAFDSNASDGFDPQLDADKFPGSLNRQTIYTTNAANTSRWLSLNVLNAIATNSLVPVGFEPGASGNYRLNFSNVNTFDPTSYIILEDRKLNIMFDVRKGAYSFSADSADNWNRFVLHFTPPAVINTSDANCNTMGDINIIQPGTANWNYTLTDSSNTVIATGVLNQNTPVNRSASVGTYVLTLVDNNNYTVMKMIQVNGSQAVKAGFETSAATVIAQTPVSFINMSENVSDFSWDFGDGSTSNMVNTDHTYLVPGSYKITLVASNTSGCSATSAETITVNALPTGINKVSESGVSVWSNKNTVYAGFSQANNNVNAVIKIYDMLGQELSAEKYTVNGLYLKQVNNIEAAYVIVAVVNNDKITTKKLFISNIAK